MPQRIKKIPLFFLLSAILILPQISVASKMSANDYLNSAKQKFSQGNLDGAVTELKKAFELGKQSDEVRGILNDISSEYFFRGGEKYMDGDKDGAIADLEKSLELNKDDTEVKRLLGMCEYELVLKHFESGSPDEAIPYLEKLLVLFPDDKAYKEMYESAKKQIVRKAESLPGVPIRKEIQQIESLFSLIESRLRKQEKLLENYEGKYNELVKKIIANTERERKELLVRLKERDREMRSGIHKDSIEMRRDIHRDSVEMRRTFIFTAIFGTLLTVAILIFSVFMLIRHIKKRAALIIWRGQKGVTGALSGSDRYMLPDGAKAFPGSQEKIEDLKVIEAEIVKEQTDPHAAEDVLQAFLQSQDSEIKAEAAKALYKHNPARSLDILEKMESSVDKKKRIYAISALGEISSTEAVKILLGRMDDAETGIKKEIIKSLKGIIDRKEPKIPAYIHEKIEQALSRVADKEAWIIE